MDHDGTLYEMNSSNNYWAWKEADIENCPVTSMKGWEEGKRWMMMWRKRKDNCGTIFRMVFKLTEALMIIFDSSFPDPVWEHFV